MLALCEISFTFEEGSVVDYIYISAVQEILRGDPNSLHILNELDYLN